MRFWKKRKRDRCPYCGTMGSHHHVIFHDAGRVLGHAVECDICQARGPVAVGIGSDKRAWELWRGAMSPNPGSFLKELLHVIQS